MKYKTLISYDKSRTPEGNMLSTITELSVYLRDRSSQMKKFTGEHYKDISDELERLADFFLTIEVE